MRPTPINSAIESKFVSTPSFDYYPKPESCGATPSSCFFCIMAEHDPSLRRARIARFFKGSGLLHDARDLVLVLIALWHVAMAHPDDDEFPSLGIFDFLKGLMERAARDGSWLLRDRNVYIPYYAAHVIGSYTMNRPEFAKEAVLSGVVPPLVELMRGTMSWVEQRAAVRALGHLASYEETFGAVAVYEEEIIPLALRVMTTCVDNVYASFVGLKGEKRPDYHRDLLTRGLIGTELEDRRAEEWASQLQCWSIYLLSCFATKGRGLHLIWDEQGLQRELCETWGGIMYRNSPAGIGLLRILCRTQVGREKISDCRQVIDALCNLARSAGDWQYMAIDCLLLLLNDRDTRKKVEETITPCLLDLVDLKTLGKRSRLGEQISRALNLYHPMRFIERDDEFMSCEQSDERKIGMLAKLLKEKGNMLFRDGNIKGAISKYSEALDVCPRNLRKERMVIHSNRSQCYLHLQEPDKAISDTTRALSLSSPTNSHGKSLWRRSQAYDMKGLAKESLMDCVMYVRWWFKSERNNNKGVNGRMMKIIPYYASSMIRKQKEATWLFRRSELKTMAGNMVGDDERNLASDPI
ncbi:hypothetical protein MLD38_022348 [Melastoma candidum]|uniref:Uncharacterized protein n=1 Tax=Melastoma candidum TaxID=119954 RepID=A0ACB9QK61_9MYRT|nr:hypothetical protein MLD38_022348 [Melastoma candidum]